MFEYAQSLILSLPAPSFQLAPSGSISSILSLVLAVIIVFVLFTVLERRRKSVTLDKPLQREGDTYILPTQKKATWFSKHRLKVNKEEKAKFWETMIMMAIGGAMLIAIGLSLPSPVSVNWFLLFTKAIIIVVGILMLGIFGTWTSDELYTEWKSRKQHKATYLKLLADFDDAFNAVQEVHEQELRIDMLHRFRSSLVSLCNNCSWDEAKDRIEKTLTLIPQKLANESPIYVQFLTITINSFGKSVTPIIGEKWFKELEALYDDPKYRTDSISNVLYILQELHGYELSFMEGLIDDATIHWSPLKFQLLADYIGFSAMKKMDARTHELILKYLRRKMDDATKSGEDEVKKRLRLLYNKAVM